MNKFEPIAVIGQGCVLPGCFSPDELWKTISQGKVNITHAKNNSWRVNKEDILVKDKKDGTVNKSWHDKGGYVTGFETVFNPNDYKLEPSVTSELDPVFQWCFYAGQQALKDSGYSDSAVKSNTGVILGNLSYPTRSFSQYFEQTYLKKLFPDVPLADKKVNSLNRFMSGLPAILTAKALGLNEDAFSLDAACSSSLYALKFACDALSSGKRDMMLVGGVCASDQVFLHVGFTALNALSPTGQSRPFNKGADGLIPAEGAAFVVLKRLSDAVNDKDNILGVIRGVGLSNDGRSGGFLSPSMDGQIRCMENAFEQSGLSPEDVSYVECHATGTFTGDATEIKSMSHIFSGCKDISIGSLKANFGHLITGSGIAGLLKVMAAMKHNILPETPNANPTIDELKNSPFRVIEKSEKWTKDKKIACISNFGFGGNNAHLILEEWNGVMNAYTKVEKTVNDDIAVVGVEIRTDKIASASDFFDLLNGKEVISKTNLKELNFNALELSFPPNDLKNTLGQQLILLQTVQKVMKKVKITTDKTSVFVGMGIDSDVCRYGFKWRLKDLLEQNGTFKNDIYNELSNLIAPNLVSAGVLGTMPNIPANRINNLFDFKGMGFTISCEELSGDKALEIAINAIRNNEVDTAIVGAVDLSDEIVHVNALNEILGSKYDKKPCDATVVLVLKRYSDALKDGDQIFAVIDEGNSIGNSRDCSLQTNYYIPDNKYLSDILGYSHSSSGLINIASAVLLASHRVRNSRDCSLQPIVSGDKDIYYKIENKSFAGISSTTIIRTDKKSAVRNSQACSLQPIVSGDKDIYYKTENKSFAGISTTTIYTYTAKNRLDLISALKEDIRSDKYSCRLAIVTDKDNIDDLRNKAIDFLVTSNGKEGWISDEILFRENPVNGEIAFVYTGAASAYADMGKDLLIGFPFLSDEITRSLKNPENVTEAIYSEDKSKIKLPFYQLAASSFLCQIHTIFSKEILGLKPDVAIGLSSGETNSMFAMGVWEDMDGLLEDISNSELYTKELAVTFDSVKKYWNEPDDFEVKWDNWLILHNVEEVKKLLSKEERVYLTIINSENDCVIGGDKDACSRIIEQIGSNKAIPLNHDISVHCDVVRPFEATWKRTHTRNSNQVKDIRFYSNYFGGVYEPAKESVAEALTGQALKTIDFPKIINKAWEDGVRVFIEHGPRNSLAMSIKSILKDKPHLVVSYDQAGKSSLTQAVKASAEMWCAGIAVNISSLISHNLNSGKKKTFISFPLHMKSIQLSESSLFYVMEAPPKLAAVSSFNNFVPVAKRESSFVPDVKPVSNIIKEKSPVPVLSPKPQEKRDESQKIIAFEEPVTDENESGQDKIIQLLRIQQQNALKVHSEYLNIQKNAQKSYLDSINNMSGQLMNFIDIESFDEPIPNPSLVSGQGAQTLFPLPSNEGRGQGDGFTSNSDIIIREPWDLGVSSANNMSGQLMNLIDIESSDEPILNPSLVSGKGEQTLFPLPSNEGRGQGDGFITNVKILPGPKFSREQLEILSSGKISSIFGPLFEQQDKYEIQVRMPEPPLLLCDRVTGIKGEPGSMGLGTIYTETDVKHDSWYLHNGRMPAGVFIEAGQADLLLISWLGIDFHNKGERAYRLLGCELVYHDSLPKAGDTLKYDIHVDGFSKTGKTTLFFFHYDCHIEGKLRISVRSGQAGFFTREELDDSRGVIWNPETADYKENAKLEIPEIHTKKSRFSLKDIEDYTNGNMVSCFGPEFRWTETHTRTPRSQSGYQNFIGEITDFDLYGGPAKRGYLKSEVMVSPDDWFFKGHFKNDPCMPGTLMAEACLQMMTFYLVALGFSTTKDGWRFEPIPGEKFKFICRGQVIPESQKVAYEIFIDEIIGGDIPKLYAHVLCTVDGNKAFLCERFALRMVPDYPLSSTPEMLVNLEQNDDKVASLNGFKFDYASLMNCALGDPSEAFGNDFKHYDGIIRSPRLPGPPYHFMTRISDFTAKYGEYKNRDYVVAEYDIPEDVWYFQENSSPTMPFAVLMEIALQPCGWFSTFVFKDETKGKELLFRNLDGTGTQYREIVPGDKTIVTKTTLSGASITGGIIISKFDVECTINNELVYEMKTVFGFFNVDAMRNQKGFPVLKEEKSNRELENNFNLNLRNHPAPYFHDSTAKLPASKLLMIDRISSYYPEGGKYNKGYIKAEKDVVISDWFFKAHFYQDPVQPGSLGIEAILQLIQFYMLNKGMHKNFKRPRFEPVLIQGETEWHYRGQITPDKKIIMVDFDVFEEGSDEKGVFVTGEARLWGDELKIYSAPRIGVRIVESNDKDEKPIPETSDKSEIKKTLKNISKVSPETTLENNEKINQWKIDINDNNWISDHCPTYTMPALPLMYELEMMVQEAFRFSSGKKLVSINNANVHKWMPFYQNILTGQTLTNIISEDKMEVSLQIKDNKSDKYSTCVNATIQLGDSYNANESYEIPVLENPTDAGDPYSDYRVFHGPAFQLMKNWKLGTNGASCQLEAKSKGVPAGKIHPGLLDAALHCIPHDNLNIWSKNINNGLVGYPYQIESMEFYSEMPENGLVDVEVRFEDLKSGAFPIFKIWMFFEGKLILVFKILEIMVPKGKIGSAPPELRKEFIANKRYFPEISLSLIGDKKSVLDIKDIRNSDWLPGTIARIYNLPDDSQDSKKLLVFKEHAANHLSIHPYYINFGKEENQCLNLPLNKFIVKQSEIAGKVSATSTLPETLDIEKMLSKWVNERNIKPSFLLDVGISLCKLFVRRVILQDSEMFSKYQGKPVLYFANHQTGVESFLFLTIIGILNKIDVKVIAKNEHRNTWFGKILELAEAKYNKKSPIDLLFFDRNNQMDLINILKGILSDHKDELFSLLVHVEGTRALGAGKEVKKLSSIFIDLSLQLNLPIVPVRLCRGLPVQEGTERFEFPVGYCMQDYYIGTPIEPETLAKLSYIERSKLLLQEMNTLGPILTEETPLPGNKKFETKVNKRMNQYGISEIPAVMTEALLDMPYLSDETKGILDVVMSKKTNPDNLDKSSIFYNIQKFMME